jgi:hypothetical protein
MGRTIAGNRSLGSNTFGTTRTLRSGQTRKISTRRISKAVCETLEERQLMSLTIEVRDSGGGTSATVTSVGQVINLQVLALVTDANNTPSEDGFEDCTGSFLSTAVDGHAIAGNLDCTANVAPFNANGAFVGTVQDLNGDGNLDVGSNVTAASNQSTASYFFARASPLQTSASPYATIVGNALEFQIATLTYTVTSLNEGGTTDINFRPFVAGIPEAAGWTEGGAERDNVNGVFQAGAPYVVSDPAIIPAPVAVNSSFSVVRNTPTSLNELSGDNIVEALNPSSVVIVSAPTHGSASLQTSGSILYTPTTGYIGADSFTYKVSDVDGRVSNVATVSINVTLPPPPTAGAVTANTFRSNAVTINVLSSDSSVATLVPSTVTVASQPTHGTAAAQANGSIIYTPASGYTGTDTFTYTVSDSNQETSTPGTVTVTVVAPTPPTAGDVTDSTFAGTPVSINVLSSDTANSGSLSPTTVAVGTPPGHGTAVAQADGSILYTPVGGYVGTDSFTYTVGDTLGDTSNVATVSLTITHAAPPSISNVTVPVTSGSPNTINVLSNYSGGAALVPGTVTIITQPSDGTATVNSSTGAIVYTPKTGFVGVDTVTYTVADVNGDTSNTATASFDVGATISSAKGATHSLIFTDAAGGKETVTLNAGSAQLFFDNSSGTLTVSKSGQGTITGTGLSLSGITLTGTTKASALVIKGVAKDPLSIGGITDTAPLGSISAPYTTVTGAISLYDAKSVTFGSISGATITVGAGLPQQFALTAGAVSNTSLTSAVPITALKVSSWTNTGTGTGTITAPSLGTLTVTGAFAPNLDLTVGGKAPSLGSANITGAVSGTAWNITGGVKSIVAGSVASTWTGSIGGPLSSLTIKSGGLTSPLTAGSIGTVNITGNVTGNITAQSASLIRVNGSISGSTLAIGTGALRQLLVSGAITNSTVSSGGNIASISAGSVTGSNFSAGSTVATFPNAAATNLGSATIGSFRTGAFAGSDLVASKISSAALGTVTTDNGGTKFGVAVDSINALSAVFGSTPVHFGRAQLINEEILNAYLNAQGIVFGDFALTIEG